MKWLKGFLGQVLAEWDFIDSPVKSAPTVFQAVYREFALLVYSDELGDDLAHSMLNNWYFWQERLQKMVLENNSSWFDNVKTANKKGATLYRGLYDFSKPYKVMVSASLRMVADLADPDKILAVLPGGVTGRQFDPHTTDQVQSFMDGNKAYWWFSDKAIKEHTKHTLTLSPN